VLPCWHGWESRTFQAFALLGDINSTDYASPVVVREVGRRELFIVCVLCHGRFVWHILYHDDSYAKSRFNSL
jgi:hypothetical protein